MVTSFKHYLLTLITRALICRVVVDVTIVETDYSNVNVDSVAIGVDNREINIP